MTTYTYSDKFHGNFALDSETKMVYRLTDCCKASGKGSGEGIVCRACYKPVGIQYGMCATLGTDSLFSEMVSMMDDHKNGVELDIWDCAGEILYHLASNDGGL